MGDPLYVCYPHGSDSDLRRFRRSKGICEWGTGSCKTEPRRCPRCGYYFCKHHYNCHIRDISHYWRDRERPEYYSERPSYEDSPGWSDA